MRNKQDLTASLFAHRLTAITDSLGNRIGEAVTDPNGALTAGSAASTTRSTA